MAVSFAKRFKRFLFAKYIILVLVIAVGVFIGSGLYYLFYRGLPLEPSFPDSWIDKYSTAVAGLLGTSITLIGLGFLTYAYRDQQKQADSELFNKLYADLLDDINSIQYRKKYKRKVTSPNDSQLFQGVDALYNYEADDDENQNSVLNHLNLIIMSFKSLVNLVEASDYLASSFKEIMLNKIYFLFYSKIYWPTCYNLYDKHLGSLIAKRWGNARILFFEYEKFTQEAFRYLEKKNLLLISPPDRVLAAILSRKFDTWQTHWNTYPPLTSRAGASWPKADVWLLRHLLINPARWAWRRYANNK